jgi:hypothetical protein
MSSQRISRPDSLGLNWPTTQDQHPEDDASIYILFHGLMCFAYKEATSALPESCEIGVHAKAPEHDFKIFVFELDGETIVEPPIYSFAPDSHGDVPGGEVTVDIQEPSNPGIHFHFPDFGDEFTWENLLDLEGPDFYPRKLGKNTQILKPKITINHGLFFLIPTNKSFEKIPDGASTGDDLGKIGFMGVSTVKHNGTGRITIKTKREELTLRASVAKPLLVVFVNACPQDKCTSQASDFPQYYKAFNIKLGEKKFHLKLIPNSQQQLNLGKLKFLLKVFDQLRAMFSNNDAPCGVAGYGRSNGVNDSA